MNSFFETNAPNLCEVIEASQIIVQPKRFVFLRSCTSLIGPHFLVCRDGDETTVITEEENSNSTPHTEIISGFRLLEIRLCVPFMSKNLVANITMALAQKKIPAYSITTISKEFLLVQEPQLDLTLDTLEDMGFPINNPPEATGFVARPKEPFIEKTFDVPMMIPLTSSPILNQKKIRTKKPKKRIKNYFFESKKPKNAFRKTKKKQTITRKKTARKKR